MYAIVSFVTLVISLSAALPCRVDLKEVSWLSAELGPMKMCFAAYYQNAR